MRTLADEVAIENARNTARIEGLEERAELMEKRLLQAAQLVEEATKTIADQKQKVDKTAIAVVNLQLAVKEMKS